MIQMVSMTLDSDSESLKAGQTGEDPTAGLGDVEFTQIQRGKDERFTHHLNNPMTSSIIQSLKMTSSSLKYRTPHAQDLLFVKRRHIIMIDRCPAFNDLESHQKSVTLSVAPVVTAQPIKFEGDHIFM